MVCGVGFEVHHEPTFLIKVSSFFSPIPPQNGVLSRKVQKKNFCYLRYFTKGCESIPQSLGFNLWTQISHEDVVMFWKRRKKGQN